jgi:hypothetical protein
MYQLNKLSLPQIFTHSFTNLCGFKQKKHPYKYKTNSELNRFEWKGPLRFRESARVYRFLLALARQVVASPCSPSLLLQLLHRQPNSRSFIAVPWGTEGFITKVFITAIIMQNEYVLESSHNRFPVTYRAASRRFNSDSGFVTICTIMFNKTKDLT